MIKQIHVFTAAEKKRKNKGNRGFIVVDLKSAKSFFHVKGSGIFLNWCETTEALSDLTQPLQDLHLVVFEPFLWSFCPLLCPAGKINLLSSHSSPPSESEGPPGLLMFFYIYLSLHLYSPSRTCCWEAYPEPDAATTMLQVMVCLWMCSVCQIYHLIWWPKFSIFASSDQRTFFHLTLELVVISNVHDRTALKPTSPLQVGMKGQMVHFAKWSKSGRLADTSGS